MFGYEDELQDKIEILQEDKNFLRELLKKYIAHVLDKEGYDFIDMTKEFPAGFTEKEIKILYELQSEINEQG